jgi:hypothetical protein
LAPFPLRRTSPGGYPPPRLEATSPGRASHPGVHSSVHPYFDSTPRSLSSAHTLSCECTRIPSLAVATPAASPSCSASVAVSRHAYPCSPLPSYSVLHNPVHARVPGYLLMHVLALMLAHASGRRWQPQPRRRRPCARRRASHDLNPQRQCSLSRPSFSSPSKQVGHCGPCHGTRCPGAVEPHRRRDHPEPPLLWGISPSTWRSTLKPKGLSCTHQPTCRGGRKGSERPRAPDHSRPSHTRARTTPRRSDPPRDRLHRATLAAQLAATWDPAGLKPPAWQPHVLLQPACSYLTASFNPFRASQ